MATLTEETVRGLVEQVLARLNAQGLGGPAARSGTGALGVHGSVDDAVAAAKEAQQKFAKVSLELRKRAIDKIRSLCVERRERWGQMELDETQIGRLDHKIEKLVTAGEQTPGTEFLATQAQSGDNGLTITEFAPFGVIGAITPVTHSLPTLASNAISMLAAGNTVVFNAHPSGANIAQEGVRAFNQAMRDQTGIDNLITIIHPPTIESAQALFAHRDVRLLVVTGGPAVARAALETSKRAIVAGPGNPPVVVDETACLTGAAQGIIRGAAYDNNLLCIGEKEVFAVASIFERLAESITQHGGFRLNERQWSDLEQKVFENGNDGKPHLRKELVGQDPTVIGQAIGVSVPPGTQILFAETSEHSPFVTVEQMMPVVPFVRVRDVHEGIRLAKQYEHNFRHTAVLHSRNTDAIREMGRVMDVTVYVVNGPSTAGLGGAGGGHLSFSIATPTGEGVTSPLTFTRQRRSSIGGTMRFI